MNKAVLYFLILVMELTIFAYFLSSAEPGCPHPKCCTKPDKTNEEQQICDQGS